MKRFLIIDAFGILYRYYFIFIKNPLLNSKGENTSAIFGFLRAYFSLIERYPSDYVCVAMDKTRETFRSKLYAPYKANREHMPEDLRAQIPPLLELIDALNIPRVAIDNYEADDVVGTLVQQNTARNIRTYIYSSDKDVMQLVDKNTTVVASSKDNAFVEYDERGVQEKWGVLPAQIVDLLALMGDASDNIPGVKGVGEKTAVKLLSEFGTLDGVYENIETVAGKLKEKLVAEKERAYISKRLATIARDVPMDLSYERYERKAPNAETTLRLADALELTSLKKTITEFVAGGAPPVKTEAEEKKEFETTRKIVKRAVNYYLIENEQELTTLLGDIRAKKEACVDFETTGLNAFHDTIVGIAFALEEQKAFYLDLSGRTPFDYEKTLLRVLNAIADPSVRIIGQNLKFEYKMAKQAGVTLSNLYFDTMLASYLLHPEHRRHNFDDIAKEYLNYKTITYDEITDGAKKIITEVELHTVVDYACEDADITLRLYTYLKPKLEQRGLLDLLFNLEMPLVPTLGDMELNGVYIDKDRLHDLSKDYEQRMTVTETAIYKEAGEEFNIGSPKQVAETLFKKMNLPSGKRTKTGFSTDESVLRELAKRHTIARLILDYRKYSKLKNTYIDVLPTLVEPLTRRVHTSYNQTVTATGRLSSSDPNLQNIPVRDEEGREIRRAIAAEEGFALVSADYSQIELRFLAHFSKDETLLAAFKNNEDVHVKTAMRIFSVSEKHVTPSMRNVAKVVNFSIIYGKTAFGLAQELDISRKEADDFIKQYFAVYKRVDEFRAQTIANAEKTGEATTIEGRIRPIENIASRNATMKREAERIAINTTIQGSAADLIKRAMVRLHRALQKNLPQANMLMQVHDELVLEVPRADVPRAITLMKDAMENAMTLSVPLNVDVTAGDNWGDIH